MSDELSLMGIGLDESFKHIVELNNNVTLDK